MAESSPTRQFVKFSFYRVDPSWRALAAEERERHKREICAAVESFSGRLQVRSYSLGGTRGDADFLLWQIGDGLEDIQELAAALMRTGLAPYLSMPYSYLAMTRRSVYLGPKEGVRRSALHPSDSRYLFVYPFVKTRQWYQLPLEERQAMMDEHIAIGRRYPSVKLNTTYSFGLDDQEFVVSFETDEPADFLDLVMELREAKSSIHTLRDTPIFTCIRMGLRETLETLGGVEVTQTPAAEPERWQRVASVAEIPEPGGKVVYFRGAQVALFREGERLYAIGNRCSHANGPLADGVVEDGTVTCPYHSSQFGLSTGEPLTGPATRPVPVFAVRVEDGEVYLAERE